MTAWLINILRGACMGIADAIPGVSGGTIALVLGIYRQFVTAISAVGPRLIRELFTRELWRRLKAGLVSPDSLGQDTVGRDARHVLFLGSLLIGIAGAVVVGARFIPDLLSAYPAQMNGFFLGLVVASIAIPLRMVGTKGARQGVALLLAAVATFVIVDLPLDQSDKSHGVVTIALATPASGALEIIPVGESTVFMTNRYGGADKKREVAFLPARPVAVPAGATSIEVPVVARLAGQVANLSPGELTASLGLPEGATVTQAGPTRGGSDPALWFVFVAGVIAISAMVLPGISGSFLLLMLGMYNYVFFNLRALIYDRDGDAFIVIAVFGVAVILGLLSFARFIRWLLDRFPDTTLAALIGIMIGSLRKLWPFTDVDAEGLRHSVLPDGLDGVVGATIGTFVAGVAIVLVLDRIGRARKAQLTGPAAR